MSGRVLFGPAGNSDSFLRVYKGSVCAPAWLRAKGLDCYEYQCGRGVHLGEATARAIGEAAADSGIAMSLHAPYFINLSGDAPERVEKNIEYILQSARVCDWMGGDRIVVHCGGLSGMTRQEAAAHTGACLDRALDALEDAGLAGVTVCLETMGKCNVFGDADEVLEICRTRPRLLPCVDLGHLNARSQGQMRTPQELAALFDRMEQALGARAKRTHFHFSHIEYGRGGEVRHLTLEDTQYGPDFAPVAELLAQRGFEGRVICESAGTQAEDAAVLRAQYEEERSKV